MQMEKIYIVVRKKEKEFDQTFTAWKTTPSTYFFRSLITFHFIFPYDSRNTHTVLHANLGVVISVSKVQLQETRIKISEYHVRNTSTLDSPEQCALNKQTKGSFDHVRNTLVQTFQKFKWKTSITDFSSIFN